LGAEQAVLYVRAGKAALGALPDQHTVVAERFFDEGGGMQLVIHAPFGARINRAWGLSLRKRFCRTFNFELQAAATDDGIVISLGEQHSFPLDAVFEFLDADGVEHVLTQAMLDSPMFTARWRWNASRALAVLRFSRGRKVPPQIQRMRSDDLLAAVFPDQAACGDNLVGEIQIPDHPLVNETIRDSLHEAMDLEGLKSLLRKIDSGEVRTAAIDTAEPSPFSHEILNANPYAYLDDAPLEERRARAVQMRRTIGIDAGEIGALDPEAIAEVSSESWPLVRDADELHDALLTLIQLPPVAEWQGFFDELEQAHRAFTRLSPEGRAFWVAAERQRLVGDVTATVRGWMESTGPTTVRALAEKLALPKSDVESAMARLESEGQVLRGRFTPAARNPEAEIEWCNRRLLARIHRMTLGKLRKEIAPVTTADFMRFLFSWQHVTTGTQLHGVDGTLHILKQLQGYEISASAWEHEVLPKRIARYSPELLDQLCLSGEVMWGRLSPHPSFAMSDTELPVKGRRVRPTRVAPVTFFLREDAPWLLQPEMQTNGLSEPARAVVEALERRGASFLSDLVKYTGQLTSQTEDALWELAAAGLVTADGFDNLRALLDPKRRRGEGNARFKRPRHAAGRWALLPHPDTTVSHDERTEAFARQLLARWGVVFRDLLAREVLSPAWRDLLVVLRRMEARGEIRGGRFVSGFLGEQFARPEAVDLLRAVRRGGEEMPLRIAAADPLNLAGIITPGSRISPLAGQSVELASPSGRGGRAERAG
jgi:ATP-dependent Lhr-like helicase